MIKKFICVMFLFSLSFTLSGKEIKVLSPAGLPTLSLVKMINETHDIDGNKITYKIEKNADALVVDMLKREGDIAIVPSNFAAQLYNKGLEYVILGTVGWGSFYIIGNDRIENIKELENKDIYAFGRGLTPDIILQNILLKSGIDPEKDIKITYVGSGNELAGFYLSEKAKIAVVPEPMLSTIMSKNKETKINFNLNNMWKTIFRSKSGYPQSTLIVKKEVLEENPELIKKFVENLKESIIFLNQDSDKRTEYVNNLNIMINISILNEILSNANIDFVEIGESKSEYEDYFKILYDTNSKVIGGKIPDEEVFADFN